MNNQVSRRTILVAAGASLTLAGVSACSKAGTTTGATTGGGNVKVAIVQKVLTSEFWQNVKSGAQAEAKTEGISLDVFAANSEDDVEGQVNLVQNALSKGYAAIGVAPISNVNLNNVLAEATKKGIYVINVDEPVDLSNLKARGGAIQGLVTTDNVKVGGMAGSLIAKHLGNSGNVAIIEGQAGVQSGVDRKNGAKSAMEKAGLTIVDSQPADWDRTKAYNVAQNFINKYPSLKAIYCCNDTMAMGAQEAAVKSGRQIVVVGTDGNSDAIKSVLAGGLLATVKQDSAKVGAESVKLMAKLVKDKPKIDVNAQPSTMHVDPILITKENAAKFVK
ncbi:D-allose transporter substrate-binding protein [Acidipropionibacterium timonense]|uniref:D-allose transporter substrate-binding protein n=1 Tax=Acidipropionibacterium timonense TaxID=2161818 RepID=UPI001031238E|nr:D-allose transporter substrate-binding protein [Acidipropionibacterium timonense]